MDLGLRSAEGDPVELAGAGGSDDRRLGHARGRSHGRVQLVDRHLDARADVEQQATATGGGANERVDHVVDEHEVAGLLTITEDRAGLPGEEPTGEDRHHTGFAVGILAGPVDVAQGERRELEIVQEPVRREVVGEHPLGDAVRRLRTQRVGLLDRQARHVGLAVDRAAAGGEHDLVGTGAPRALENVQGPDDVDRRIEHRVGDRDPHVGLGGEVEHDVG